MKTSKNILISILALIVLTIMTGVASARTNVSIGVGFGYPGFYGSWNGYYGHHGWRHHHGNVVVGGYLGRPYYYPRYPRYYVPAPPRPPIIAYRVPGYCY